MPLLWQAPIECPDLTEVERRIAARGVATSDIDVTVVVEPGFVAHVGGRVLTDPSCDALADAVAIVVARIVVERAAQAKQVVPPTPPKIEPVVPPPVVREPETPWAVAARLAIAGGIGPDAWSGGGELAVRASRGSRFVELAAARWLARDHRLPASMPDVLAIHLDTASARGGVALGALRGWLVVDAGAIVGDRAGTDADGPWVAAGGGAGVVYGNARVKAVGGVEALVDLAPRITFALTDGEVVARTRRGAARAWLGIEVAFP